MMTSRGDYYVLRYVAGTNLQDRKHVHTLGRYPTWLAAEDARLMKPHPERLEVQGRSDVKEVPE